MWDPWWYWTFLPLGAVWVSGKGLRPTSLLLTHSGPWTSLGRWGELSLGNAGCGCCRAHACRTAEPENLGRGAGMDTGGIKVERVRSFCFTLKILSELLRRRFCCCLPGGGHCPSHWAALQRLAVPSCARQAFLPSDSSFLLPRAFPLEALGAFSFVSGVTCSMRPSLATLLKSSTSFPPSPSSLFLAVFLHVAATLIYSSSVTCTRT